MRVSSDFFHQTTIRNIQRSSVEYSDLSVQMASGKRIQRPSDDPLGKVSLMTLESQLRDLEQYERNIESVNFELSQQESQLTGIMDQLFSVQGLVIQAADGSSGPSEIQAYAQELSALESNIVSFLNSRDGSGHAYFGGSELDTEPFLLDTATNTYLYQGDNHVRQVSVANNAFAPSNITGQSLDPGATFLNAMRQYVTDISDPATTNVDVLSQNMIAVISDFSAKVNQGLTEIGSTMSSLETLDKSNRDIREFTQGLSDDINAVDYPEAYIKVNETLASYESTMRVYSSVTELSLFSLI
ncbi:flagellar hook-associated protein FlgL [Alteromonas sp. S015]|uniref:flagellar hook-associated protein FlgL n=1 Tax=Alteromonas sp. S015 TaxID=3117401 RepID=UPI002FE10294